MRFDYGEYGDFDSFFTGIDEIMEWILAFLAILLAVAVVALVLALICYIFRAIALSTMARKRGIAHGWLAWLPIADQWVLGSLSDQYRYVTRRQIRYQRWVLLGLAILGGLISSANNQTVSQIAQDIFYSAEYAYQGAAAPSVSGTAVTLTLVGAAVSLAALIFKQMALYDIYTSARPTNKVVFLVLGLIFPFLQPFFLFACRNQEQGMPPRRESRSQPEVEPARDYQEPWETF